MIRIASLIKWCLSFLLHTGILCSYALAQTTPGDQVGDQVADDERSFLNLQTPTLGGKQLWTDFQWRNGWRIQQNVLTKHWRLLDPNNIRHAWGTRAACDAELNARQPGKLLPTTHAVVLMHGLGRSSSSMKGLAKYLSDAGFGTTICLEYASSRDSISQHAAALREVIDGLPTDVRLNFVGHSMGNIVVRHAIGDWQQAGASGILNRIEHVVMLGPPNQGASIARQLARTGVFGWVAGEGALELGKKWGELEVKLAKPPCPFGIIAGRLSESAISNPLVDGEGDFVVSVEETKLDGAADFLEVPVLHSFLMDAPQVQRAVASFLRSTKFDSP
jgi:pimeloyl-ACP methyl ester carboxylesterase